MINSVSQMRKRALGLLLLFLLVSTSAHSAGKDEKLANIAISFQIGANTISAIKNHELKSFIISNLITIALAETAKHFIHKDRPDHSDSKSFFSEHSALAANNCHYKYWMCIPLAGLVGEERLRTNKHDVVDVTTGWAVGSITNYLVHRK